MFEQLFPLVMENDPNLIFVKDANSVILYANKAFLEVYPPEKRNQIIGTTTVEDFTAEEAALWLSEDRRALDVGRSEMVEEIADYSGRKRVFLTRKIAFKCITGEPRLLGICTDISDLAHRERNLVEANKQLEQFTAFAAHDLRSPIASFVSALELINRDKETSLSHRSQSYLNLMIESAHGLSQQVTAMLIAAKADQYEPISKRDTDLNLLMEEVRFNLSALLERTGTTLYTARLPHMTVEPSMFRQLMQNLVENSVKHRAERLPMVVVRCEETAAHHTISVEDNGEGIPPGEMKKVFDAFAQGSSAKSGTGVGLALCQRVVNLHDGDIQIDPLYRGGCRIVLTFPKDGHTVKLSDAA